MKPIYYMKAVFLTIAVLLSGTIAFAQNEEAEKEKQQALEAEKKAQMEMLMQERKKALQDQQKKMRQLEEEYADQAEFFERQARDYSRWTVPQVTGIAMPEGQVFVSSWGQENQSQLTIRKNFRGTTNTSKGKFDVEPDIRRFRCMINGTVRTGEIVITVEYPDGKTFKELTINSSADINFSQSISIEENEADKYVGSWTYVIKADDAEGNYMLQIMTN
jgi:hypothetical protein